MGRRLRNPRAPGSLGGGVSAGVLCASLADDRPGGDPGAKDGVADTQNRVL